jgi:hypothetical protein
MIKITCVNPRCPGKSFLWNELTELGSPHDLAKQDDPDVVQLIVTCTYCNTENAIWAKKSGIKKGSILRGDNNE